MEHFNFQRDTSSRGTCKLGDYASSTAISEAARDVKPLRLQCVGDYAWGRSATVQRQRGVNKALCSTEKDCRSSSVGSTTREHGFYLFGAAVGTQLTFTGEQTGWT
ncbi:uncharacterized protein LOC117218664 [Megalopta genalis]|uniref:uncharacterized protein LOC117218664 n=1 Tax=Megalopta genalis TaxID=115081 RepID=UPI0014435D69|nr:uncharacterized protein LOC117218664 [Megalopta genalis]